MEERLKKRLREGENGKYYQFNQYAEFLADSMVGVELIKRRGKEYVYNCPCAFDIETTSFYRKDDNGQPEKIAIMYIWMFGINGNVIIGRTWAEFHLLLDYIAEKLELKAGEQHLYVYVHNLAFELGFIQNQFVWYDQFSLGTRKPVYFTTNTGFTFKCSYVLSGCSLSLIGKSLLKYKVKKKDGDLNYNLMRNDKTILTDTEMQYCINDVLVVMAYIQEKIETDGNITKILKTKTAYVRKQMTNNCLYDKGIHNTEVNKESGKKYYLYHRKMKNMPLIPDEYKQCKRGFSGGFTHTNCNYVGIELPLPASSDYTSSYPGTLCAFKFPAYKGELYTPKDYDDFIENLRCYNCLFDVEFKNISATFHYEHYISRSKCFEISGETVDNGRIVEAKHLLTTITEVDWDIISKTYEFEEFTIYNFRRYIRQYLPRDFIKTVLDLYQLKTTLKGVKSDDGSTEKLYQISKENLNSLYGMCVTDICKPVCKLNNHVWTEEPVDLKESLEKYNNSKTRCVSYLWGIWCTAYSRHNLWTAILELKEDYIYSDTDSVKYLNPDKHKDYFENYNKIITSKLDAMCLTYGFDPELTRPKTITGKVKQLGAWDFEGYYKRIKCLGAKRYLTEDDEGIHLTVAGLGKNDATKYLIQKYKTYDNIFKHFDNNLKIPAEYLYKDDEEDDDTTCLSGTGKMTHTYIEYEYSGIMTDYQGHKSSYHEYSGVHLEAAEYNLSLASEFIQFLKHIQK